MMEVVVVSGKGGTGKTSLVGSLAVLSKNKVLVDCDVDAADLHLILNNSVQNRFEFTGGKRARIIARNCTSCGACLDYCRFDAIKRETTAGHDVERYWIDKYSCDGCGVCVRHCPEQAIEFKEVVNGEWFVSSTAYGPLVHARLGLAQANSGKLVSLLRQQARLLAEQQAADLILVDGPPGIGCPVIASITGAGFILLVTEPSMSAIHDMKRMLQLTKHFNIPTGICINKSDINPELTAQIEEFAVDQNSKILGCIPYDPSVTAAQVAGTTVVEHGSDAASTRLRQLWSNLSTELKKLGLLDARIARKQERTDIDMELGQ